jgi:integration host factor subunit alpha
MTKIEIVEKIHNELDFSKKDSSELLEAVFSIMEQTLGAGEDIKISGFGKFEVKQKKDRRGRNPATGETITIGARRILAFKPSNKIRQAINQ